MGNIGLSKYRHCLLERNYKKTSPIGDVCIDFSKV
jgi:hypothetical protein